MADKRELLLKSYMEINTNCRQAAVDDLKEIGRYTLNEHGQKQRNKYLRGLERRFELLAENPNFGGARDDVIAGYRCSDYEKHLIFYIVRENFVEILAVLHESMLPELHL